MTTWLKKPKEEAYLLNPAFCCLGITAAVVGYQTTANRDMPLPLVYTVLPITLHKSTRELLPRSRRTTLPMWIQDNAAARILFYERLISLKEFTGEAILFGYKKQWLSISAIATIRATYSESELRRVSQSLDEEPKDCILKALFVGKWFAAAGSTSTVMALWGIKV